MTLFLSLILLPLDGWTDGWTAFIEVNRERGQLRKKERGPNDDDGGADSLPSIPQLIVGLFLSI